MLTLREWQNCNKDPSQYIIQASTVDGGDRPTAMSIGMGYGIMSFKDNLHTIQLGSHSELVLCAISESTDERRRGPVRKEIVKSLEINGVPNVKLDHEKYFTCLPSYKFVISPEGNGIDCHRHYEALMAGCIPIVEYSKLVDVKYGNVPILWTKDYSEITPEYLEEKYVEFLDKRWDFSLLHMSAWSIEEQLLAKYRGNYWMMRLTGKMWYEMDQMGMGAYVNKNEMLFLQGGYNKK